MLSQFSRLLHMIRKDRQISSLEEIRSLIQSTPYATLGLFDFNEKKPYSVPLSFGVEWDNLNKNPIFYFHSSLKGKKMNLFKTNTHACVTLIKTGQIKPVTYNGSIPDICTASMYYESAIAQGTLEIIEDIFEKKRSMEFILDHYGQPTAPINLDLLKKTCVYKVITDEITGKRNLPK